MFVFYREHGYPDYDAVNVLGEIRKIRGFDIGSIWDESTKTIRANLTACSSLWTYFPHWKDVRCSGQPSLAEMWNDDDSLKSLIRKTIVWKKKHNEGNSWTANRFRQNAKVFLSKQSVSNFHPTAAKLIYDTFAGNGGKVFDMSAGWGGRLMGFIGSCCYEYVACDPSTKTVDGLNRFLSDYRSTIDALGKRAEVNCIGVEDFEPREGHFDLCFTSPPYFDTEQYAQEDTQSFRRYPTPAEWQTGFLRGMMRVCAANVRDGGFVIVNIANTSKHKWLEPSTCEEAERAGLEFREQWNLGLSAGGTKSGKSEPIFIFSKGMPPIPKVGGGRQMELF